eukprot:gnl/TRDRNA2_/TRDRNA2_63772_c0_seq1.p1 gnl/TRDRNA2_/TRDRNA2_63772_c0~~gnl/TRDRNA2_/TRDRNA2_63772_c0_seq1.p1  ORF type:complete len:105 (+),score=9.90 gnl/TRDRNA2_/TRDRNA2_63772_c0_seq1:290-604(+)
MEVPINSIPWESKDNAQALNSNEGHISRSEAIFWTVVAEKGCLVRDGMALTSIALDDRLALGAQICQVELVENRLHYKKVNGKGPQSGWVSIALKDTPLLRKAV